MHFYRFVVLKALICLVQTHHAIIPADNFVTEQLKKYFIHYYRNYSAKNEYHLCNYVNVKYSCARDISDWTIKSNECPSIIPEKVDYLSKRLHQPSAHFLFMCSINELNSTIEILKNYTFWNSKAEHHFVICEVITDLQFLDNFLKYIWKKRILNFVVVFIFNKLEIISLNPFKANQIMNITRHPEQLFLNKLLNMHGYQLNVSLFEQGSLLFKDNEKWYGMDYKVLKQVASVMNFSIKIVEPSSYDHTAAYNDVSSGKTEFCFNSFIRTYIGGNKFVGAEYTVLREPDVIIMLMPINSASRHSISMVTIFDSVAWLLIIILTALISTILTVSSGSKHPSFSRFFLYTLNSLLGNGIPDFDNKRFTVKLYLIIYILGTIIIRTAFNCFLISCIVKPSSVAQLTTVKELAASKIPIYSSEILTTLIPKEYGLKHQYVIVGADERTNRLYNLDTRGAYLVTLRIAKHFLDLVKGYKKDVPFYILEEPLMPGINCYLFQKDSPYIDRVNSILLQEVQFQWTTYGEERKKQDVKNTGDEDTVVLTIRHFESLFYLLSFALGFSFVVFLIEILTACGKEKQFRSKRHKY
ncbi:hypothetical protein Zmor_007460 [Zophobas morio]|uniref:Ionotropic receptor n=1 Tax=Zophobas morio TaxID=2755281 RepID=A0AA38IWR4_9CUCU|nr:hypothetical protein Zmor_007460 [Zophobas morio]